MHKILSKSYFILLFFLLDFLFAQKNVKETKEDEIRLPKIYIKILFPFVKTEKVSLLLSITRAYADISFITVYGLYFILGRTWDWGYINSVWFFTFVLVVLIGGIIDAIFLAVRSQRGITLGTTVLYWGMAIIAMIIMIFYLKEFYFKYIVII